MRYRSHPSSPENIENWAGAAIITVRGMSLGVFPSLPHLSGERPSCRDCLCQTCVTSSELNNFFDMNTRVRAKVHGTYGYKHWRCPPHSSPGHCMGLILIGVRLYRLDARQQDIIYKLLVLRRSVVHTPYSVVYIIQTQMFQVVWLAQITSVGPQPVSLHLWLVENSPLLVLRIVRQQWANHLRAINTLAVVEPLKLSN
jgi:hypothetical protein